MVAGDGLVRCDKNHECCGRVLYGTIGQSLGTDGFWGARKRSYLFERGYCISISQK